MQRAGTLSGGQQQRVAIARALMQQPKVMLADEPIASLDPLNAKIVMDALRDINLREGITVITNLHTLDTARAYCNRIIGMAAGKVVFDGPPEELTATAVREVYGTDGRRPGDLRGDHLDQHQRAKASQDSNPPVPLSPPTRGSERPDRLARVKGTTRAKLIRGPAPAGDKQERHRC